MKKLAILAAAAAVFTAPAFAGTITVKLESSSGAAYEVVFDDVAGTATMGDQVNPYTFDEEAKKLCSAQNGEEVCLTFAEVKNEVGFSTTYTASNGNTGTATVLAVTESE